MRFEGATTRSYTLPQQCKTSKCKCDPNRGYPSPSNIECCWANVEVETVTESGASSFKTGALVSCGRS